MNLSEIDMVR